MANDITKKKVVISDMKSDTGNKVFETETSKVKKSSNKYIIWTVGIIILFLAVGSSIYFYTKYQDVKSNPTQAITKKNSEETDQVLRDLKSILLISETDAPTVARVEDPEKLRTSNPDFYRDIQKSDYLIIFPKRAIIYRESERQIINIAPIINASDLQKPAETPAEVPEEE